MERFFTLLLLLGLMSCNTLNQEGITYTNSLGFVESSPMINDYGKTILERFDPPIDYDRVGVKSNTFGEFLRTLPLKPEDAQVHYFNGKVKTNDNIYVSVVDMPLSPKNLQISPDAVMRLLSEFLYQNNKYDQIVFHSDKERISFDEFAKGDYGQKNFQKYLDYVMENISTPNFCSDLKNIKLSELKIGDVFVQNSQPHGHAVIVVDLVQNKQGKRLFLLAQGFQPAQDIQILANPNNDELSPWYEVKEGELLTPEWRFMTNDLMRFKYLQE